MKFENWKLKTENWKLSRKSDGNEGWPIDTWKNLEKIPKQIDIFVKLKNELCWNSHAAWFAVKKFQIWRLRESRWGLIKILAAAR